MYVLLTGINHRTAPVEIREKFAFSNKELENFYQQFQQVDEIEGVVVLTTCNRTEIYATTKNINLGLHKTLELLCSYAGMSIEDMNAYVYQPNCYNAIEHLFKVSAGLDSMILGESQILGQVKEAFQKALDLGASDSVLNSLFQKAIFVGKKARTDTAIDKHPVSVSYTAVELARSTLGNLQDKTALVIGAGEMGELTARYLLQFGVASIIVSNRSFDKAVEMANAFNGVAVRFDRLPEHIKTADIVISCTAANHYVLRRDNCGASLEARNGSSIMLIDIAVPRDIDPALKDIEGVHIYDIDDLQMVVDANFKQRQKAAYQAEKIIAGELVKFNEWLAGLYVIPVITAMRTRGEQIKQNEIKKALNRLGKISAKEQQIIAAMANSIVNRLLHYPITNLKDRATTNEGHLYAEIAKNIFELDIDLKEQMNYADNQTGDKRQ